MAGGSHGANKIVKPGYHIRPRFDLHGLRHQRTDDHKGHVAGELPLTSMIDMFAILVIYLLMNFSSTGEIFFPNKNFTLPKALATSPLSSSPLISIVGERFVLEAPPEYEVEPLEDQSQFLENVTNSLKNLKVTAEQKKMDHANRVNIQAPDDMEIGQIKRAMTAAVAAGWTNINFAVSKIDK